jgi:hypothetical protein
MTWDLAAAVPRDLSEALADRYTFRSELGKGGMSTVYLAMDRRHERPVAVKILNRERSAELGAERFEHEIKLLARLRHRFILPLQSTLVQAVSRNPAVGEPSSTDEASASIGAAEKKSAFLAVICEM